MVIFVMFVESQQLTISHSNHNLAKKQTGKTYLLPYCYQSFVKFREKSEINPPTLEELHYQCLSELSIVGFCVDLQK